jgi:NhaP-type Na+/H+ or K+/H+ antiporter
VIYIALFVVLLFLYSLVSKRLETTVVTAPLAFTAAGMLAAIALPEIDRRVLDRPAFLLIAEIGLVMTLFTDATRTSLRTLRGNRNLPVRLLSTGMLLTIALGAVAAKLLLPGLTLFEAGILGAILAPTDAGLGQVIVNSDRVPQRIRQALNVEAGLNDGLAVPFLMVFLELAREQTGGAGSIFARFVLEQLGYGVAIGGAIGLAGGFLLEGARRRDWIAGPFRQIGLVTLPAVSMLACEETGASMFIAAFVAGLAVQVGLRDAGAHAVEFAEEWGQLLDFLVFFLFGAIATPLLLQLDASLLVYALASLTVARMLPVALALAGSGLRGATVLFMGWFGPRGLASIVLGVFYVEQEARLPGEATIRLAVILTVLLSIVLHGLSALPGIDRYERSLASLPSGAPEREVVA